MTVAEIDHSFDMPSPFGAKLGPGITLIYLFNNNRVPSKF
jgi:hypothetical protein